MAAETAEIICEGVAKVFADGTRAIAPLTVRIAAGRTTALIGPSGCGKSTLLRLIAGLEQPSAGRVTIGGRDPDSERRRGSISVAFQDPSLLPWLTVRANVALGRRLARRSPDPDLIERLIELVGLTGFADARPVTLSGGMRQRVAIARALASQPRILLLDEPFGAVDELTRQQLARDLHPLWDGHGTTTILVTHSIHEAVTLADRVLVLSSRPARILADLPVTLPRPRDPELQAGDAFRDLTRRINMALSRGDAGDMAAP